MYREHYNTYLHRDFDLQSFKVVDDNVLDGLLVKKHGFEQYRIKNGIPRFVNLQTNYTDNFGYQWRKFRTLQLDSANGADISSQRLYRNSHWSPRELLGKRVLEVGSGAGRFTEILIKAGAEVVSFDFSNAVEANYDNNGANKSLFLMQADLYRIPFPDNYFDFILCYGVLQHTPSPLRALKAIYDKLKVGGKLSVDNYLKSSEPTVWSTPKYKWRPFTKKLNPQILLAFIKTYMPLWFPIDTALKKLPRGLGYRILARTPVPCYNYLGYGLSFRQRYRWAVLDTFDALSAAYDFPKTETEFYEMIASLNSSHFEVSHGGTGLVANITK